MKIQYIHLLNDLEIIITDYLISHSDLSIDQAERLASLCIVKIETDFEYEIIESNNG